MAVDHERIRRLLEDSDEASDTSLRAKTLKRALQDKVPTTLTAYEWQEWYAEHGVPDSHSPANPGEGRRPWWRRWFQKDN